MTLYRGIVQGLIKLDDNGVARTLPFDTFISDATFTYVSESIGSETFDDNGIKALSNACTSMKSATLELSSTDLTLAFMQAATATLARDAEINTQKVITVKLSEVNLTPESTYDLGVVPVVGTDIIAANSVTGELYPVTLSGTVLTFDADLTGTRVTITYEVAATGTNNEIALGSGQELGEVGLYGTFKGCGGDILIMMKRCQIDSNLSFAVGSDAAQAAFTAKALRDSDGNLAVMQFI